MSKIVICDDDEGILDIIETYLTGEGYEVLSVKDLDNIYNVIKDFSPDLIFLDLWMPYLTGDEIAKTLKKDPTTKDIPIVIISASKDTEKMAIECGVNAYIYKPFDLDDLLKMINMQLSKPDELISEQK